MTDNELLSLFGDRLRARGILNLRSDHPVVVELFGQVADEFDVDQPDDVQEWLDRYIDRKFHNGNLRVLLDNLRLGVEMQVEVGGARIALTANTLLLSLDTLSIDVATFFLWKAVMDMYSATRSAPPMPSGNGLPEASAKLPESATWADIIEFLVGPSKDGKGRYYRVRGGEFSKFGLAVWPEVLKRDAPRLMELSIGGHDVKGRFAYVKSPDGKATKVVAVKLND